MWSVCIDGTIDAVVVGLTCGKGEVRAGLSSGRVILILCLVDHCVMQVPWCGDRSVLSWTRPVLHQRDAGDHPRTPPLHLMSHRVTRVCVWRGDFHTRQYAHSLLEVGLVCGCVWVCVCVRVFACVCVCVRVCA